MIKFVVFYLIVFFCAKLFVNVVVNRSTPTFKVNSKLSNILMSGSSLTVSH